MPEKLYRNCLVSYYIDQKKEGWRGDLWLAFDFEQGEREVFERRHIKERPGASKRLHSYEEVEKEVLINAFSEIDRRLGTPRDQAHGRTQTFPPLN